MQKTVDHPWHRTCDESADAYLSFLAYCRFGPNRTLAAAYRKMKGAGMRARQPRAWDEWAQDHHWEARAAAYDEHQENVGARDRARKFRHSAKVWYARRARQNERSYRFGLALFRRAKTMLRSSAPRRGPGGVLKPADLQLTAVDLKKVQEIGLMADAMVRDACTRAIPQQDVVPGASVMTLAGTAKVREQAEKDLEKWREEQMPGVLEFLNGKNPLDEPGADPEDPPGPGNAGPANWPGARATPPSCASGTG